MFAKWRQKRREDDFESTTCTATKKYDTHNIIATMEKKTFCLLLLTYSRPPFRKLPSCRQNKILLSFSCIKQQVHSILVQTHCVFNVGYTYKVYKYYNIYRWETEKHIYIRPSICVHPTNAARPFNHSYIVYANLINDVQTLPATAALQFAIRPKCARIYGIHGKTKSEILSPKTEMKTEIIFLE